MPYNDYTALETVIMGNARLYAIMQQRDALYQKPDFDEQDGIRVAELEAEFAEMNGYDAETDAQKLLQGLGLPSDVADRPMHALPDAQRSRCCWRRRSSARPDILLLDEPTNHLDIAAVAWLEDFLLDYPGTLVVVSHDRHFLNNVCTHIIDIDYGKVNLYVGNYDFWYESSQLMRRIQREQKPENRGQDQRAAKLHRALFGQPVQIAPGHLAQKAAGQVDHRVVAGQQPQVPVCELYDGARLGKEILFVEHPEQDHRRRAGAQRRLLSPEQGRQGGLCGRSELSATTLLQILAGELAPTRGRTSGAPAHRSPTTQRTTRRILNRAR